MNKRDEVTGVDDDPSALHRAWIDYFGITAAGSSVKTEVIAGFTTWMTMAYILFVNPSVLGAACPDRDGLTPRLPAGPDLHRAGGCGQHAGDGA